MGGKYDSGPARTTVERVSDRELVVTRTFDAPARMVFKAWTTPELFKTWWAPKSMGATIVSCEMDVRSGGSYRIEFGHPSSDQTMAFFGKYTDVVPNARITWTNEESADGPVTTVTFEEKDGKTFLVHRETYPSKAALDASFEGMESSLPEQFLQLDSLLPDLGAKPARAT